MKHETAEEVEELPKITAAHLRRAGSMCARRLAKEHGDRKSMRLGLGRFRVQNQLLEDARLTHVDLSDPDPRHFRASDALTAEERRLYDAAARWYVALYRGRPVRSVDLDDDAACGGVDTWSTRDEQHGVRLVGRCGLTVEDRLGAREVRILRLGRGVPAGDLLDDVDVRFTLLRLRDWAGARLLVSVADVVHGAQRDASVELAAVREPLDTWFAERVVLIRERAEDATVTPGLDCGTCRFIPGCKAHS